MFLPFWFLRPVHQPLLPNLHLFRFFSGRNDIVRILPFDLMLKAASFMVPKPFYSFIALSQKLRERTSRKPQIKSSSQVHDFPLSISIYWILFISQYLSAFYP
ncbi:hypothetical protein AAG906_034130 [Vitis piasezkii]